MRFFLVLVALVHYSGRVMSSLANDAVAQLHVPPFLFQFLPLPYPMPPEYLPAYQTAFFAIGVCAMLGLFTRVSLVLFSGLLIYLMGSQAAIGWFDHEASVSSQIFLILALAPGSTSYSLDKLLKWAYQRIQKRTASLREAIMGKPVPVWGVRLILILVTAVYFTAGFSKIRFSEGRWVDGKTLTFYLDGRASIYQEGDMQRFFGEPTVEKQRLWKDGFSIQAHHYMNAQRQPFNRQVGETIAAYSWLIIAFSVATVLSELLAPLALLGGWFRVAVLITFILIHNSIGFLMNISFRELLVIDFFLIDWVWVYTQLELGRFLKKV